MKVIAERRADGTAGQLLGVHMAGPWVTEQLGAGYYAVNWEATAEEAAALIQPHPSLSETFGETLLALGGTGPPRWLTSPCRRSASPSPRASSRSGSRPSATASSATSRSIEISTDKVDSEMPSPAAGVLAEILVKEGDTVEVGDASR